MSLDAGGRRGQGQRAVASSGSGSELETGREVVRAVATVEAALSWPCLATEGCSEVQAIVTCSLNVGFSRKCHRYDDASYEKCGFSVLPRLHSWETSSGLSPRRRGASTVEGHSEKTDSNESF